MALLQRGADVDAERDNAMTPLHMCAEHGSADIAVALLQRGANVNALTGKCATPLYLSVQYASTEVALALLEKGAEVNAKVSDDSTPLHLCAEKGRTEIAMALLERGADLNAKREHAMTPLHMCACRGTTDIALALLENGAAVDAVSKCSSTPLHLCSSHGWIKIAMALLDKGANVDAVDKDADTALILAARNGHLVIVKALIEKDASIVRQNKNGDSALHLATRGIHLEVLNELINRAPEDIINLENNCGQTCLHIAAVHNSEPMARLLVDAGARRDLRDKAGNIPFDYTNPNQLALGRLLATSEKADFGVPDPPEEIENCLQLADDADDSGISSKQGHVKTPPSVSLQGNVTGVSYVSSQLQEHVDCEKNTPVGEEDHQQTDGDESTSSSASEAWTPDFPYGTYKRMLTALEILKPGCEFAEDYVISPGSIAGKAHVRFAEGKFRKKEHIVLKYYCNEDMLENALDVHSKLKDSEYICSVARPLRTTKTGLPPCIAYEKGTITLRAWLHGDRSLIDKKWCLHQVLNGIKDAHSAGIVHGDLKPSNVMFFGDDVRWKLIDFDSAKKAGAERVACFTATYASPEVLIAQKKGEWLPAAQPSMDMWSFGVVAYEVLTGKRFFGEELSLEEVCELLEGGMITQNLEQVKNVSEREALSNFFRMDPGTRWTASDAMQNELFHADSSVTTTSLP